MKVLEHYTSVQGEGPHVGKLTQFVRFAGCNMRCPGWPCDTQHAIEPSLYFRKYVNMEPAALLQIIIDKYIEEGAKNICFTGGEPFMQPINQIAPISSALGANGYTVEFFTNGSYLIPESVLVPQYTSIMMDWKLAGSGEAETHRVMRTQNALRLFYQDGIKFVVTDYKDFEEAIEVYNTLKAQGCKATFWVAPAWDRVSESVLIEWMKATKVPFRLNVQIHKYIWPASMIGV